MTRPLLLDLYCGAGGCSAGYVLAGFDVIGVDARPQPRYPYDFVQGDALAWLADLDLSGFDAIHASPPCQLYTKSTARPRAAGVEYPDLLAPTRDLLDATGLPWVIENVPGAPMRPDYKLCGCMFGLPLLKRERWFETSWRGFSMRQPCSHESPSLSVTGHGPTQGRGQKEKVAAWLGHHATIHDARAAMGIDWMNRDELAQAIPPAYTEFIGRALIGATREVAS